MPWKLGKVLGLNPMLVCLLEEGWMVLDEVPVVFYFLKATLAPALWTGYNYTKKFGMRVLADSDKCSTSP